jgi:hypothetical protein
MKCVQIVQIAKWFRSEHRRMIPFYPPRWSKQVAPWEGDLLQHVELALEPAYISFDQQLLLKWL